MASNKEISVGVQITGDAKGFKQAADEASKASSKLKQNINKDTKDIGNSFWDIDDKIKSLGKTITAVFVAEKVANFAKECVTLAAKAEGVKAAFDRLNDDKLLDNLRAATHNTVDDLVLMTYAVRASNFQISLKNLSKYFEFASKRARETGESVDYLVESIITGIGRKSAMILDNLGISASQLNEQLKLTPDYADAVGTIISKSMKNAGEYTETTADKIDQLNVAWTNLKLTLGQIATSPVAKTLNFITNAVKGLTDEDISRWAKLQAFFIGGLPELSVLESHAQEARSHTIDYLSGSISELNNRLDELNEQKDTIKQMLIDPFNQAKIELGATDDELNSLLTTYNSFDQRTKKDLKEAYVNLYGSIRIRGWGDVDKLSTVEDKYGRDKLKQFMKLADSSNIDQLSKYNEELATINQTIIHLTNNINKLNEQQKQNSIISTPTVKSTKEAPHGTESGIATGNIVLGVNLTQIPKLQNQLGKVKVELEDIYTTLDKLSLKYEAIGKLGDAFDKLGQIIGGSGGEMVSFAGKAIEALSQVGAEYVQLYAQALSSGAMSATASGARLPYPYNLVAMASALSTFMGLAMSFPKLADGGIAYGNSIVNVGEYAGASTNPEVIAPLDKLQSIIGNNGGKIEVVGKIKGTDIYLSNRRAAAHYYKNT